MGFYGPSQLIQDCRRHGVEVLPVRVERSDWECGLENPSESGATLSPALSLREAAKATTDSVLPKRAVQGRPTAQNIGAALAPALRLGLNQVKGLSESGARRLVLARSQGPFTSTQDLARRADLGRRDLKTLADAGALAGLAGPVGHRRQQRWQALGVERLPALLADSEVHGRPPTLSAPSEGEDLLDDYASLGLTLGRHPLALIRAELDRRGLRSAATLQGLPHGSYARTAGIVITRQRPASAAGVTFVTLEDESGSSNIVVWQTLAQRRRRELLGARLLGVSGTIERDGRVVHLVARNLEDHSELLGELTVKGRDFR